MMVQAECRAKRCLSYAEVPPIQAAGKSKTPQGLLKVNFAGKREQRLLAGYAEQEQMMVQTECRAKRCLNYAEVPPIQAAGKSSPRRGLLKVS